MTSAQKKPNNMQGILFLKKKKKQWQAADNE